MRGRRRSITAGPGLNGKTPKANRLEPGPQTSLVDQVKTIVAVRARTDVERVRLWGQLARLRRSERAG